MDKGRFRARRGGGGARDRGRATATATSTGKGVFANGIWHCNCSPRLPAEHFRVKKEGANKGRWFYTCQQRQPNGAKGCDFFLWDEEAKPREEAAVLTNSRTEPQQEVQPGCDAGRRLEDVPSDRSVPQGKGLFSGVSSKQPVVIREDSETPSPEPELPSANVSRKRNARDMMMDDEEEFSLGGDEEKELFNMAISSRLETPQKAQKTGVYATPATTGRKSPRTLPWLKEQQPITPVTEKRKTVVDYFASPSAFKSEGKAVTFQEPESVSDEATPATPIQKAQDVTATIAAPATPSPAARHKDALVDPADSASSLTSEVLAELSSAKLPPEKLSTVRSILSKHDLKTQGVTKGRDISRLAIKARDAKILQLESTIASLEAQRELDRSVISQLKWRRDNAQEDQEESQL